MTLNCSHVRECVSVDPSVGCVLHEDSVCAQCLMEGRRRHILEEYTKLQKLEGQEVKILGVGAGFIGVEWVKELEFFFLQMKLTIVDFLPRCLGPLPDSAADYSSECMSASGIKEFYDCKYDPKKEEFWKQI